MATAGPISGFIAQPIVGVISDSLPSKFGRRRPFILGGTLCCAFGMGLIATSDLLGTLLGDNPKGDSMHDHRIAIVFAIIGLWIMNLCVNIIQGPARAIVADLLPDDKQQIGNATVSAVMGLAGVIACVVGAQFFGKPNPYRYLFLIGVGFVLLACLPTIIAAKEVPYVRREGQPRTGVIQVFTKIFLGFKRMPGPMLRVALLYFLSWCAYTPYMVNLSVYFGENVYGNGPNTDSSQFGLKMAMYALAIASGVQWLFSLVLPSFIKVAGVKIPYFTTQLIATACYALFYWFPHPKFVPYVLMAAIAPNFATFNSIPYAIVGTAGKDDAGLYMGVLNSASVVAQTITGFMCTGILTVGKQNVGLAIAFGGALSLLACLCVFLIKAPENKVSETTPLINDDRD
eukprot:TRINITY_DN1333_c0_g1_i4.p1 TRINITY_DN1333_c0_g1~~TRINITY_DN1333_c0_g1_i4.p1  ORF type:complete len:460 (+),score=51.81 TRINITY_DN1333_c0_g1_i4:178-1380(+)